MYTCAHDRNEMDTDIVVSWTFMRYRFGDLTHVHLHSRCSKLVLINIYWLKSDYRDIKLIEYMKWIYTDKLIRRLYALVNSMKTTTAVRNKACGTLLRYGFNPMRTCILLTSIVDKLLVHIEHPALHIREVFPCVDFRDKMHGLMIFLHRQIMGALNCITWNSRKDYSKYGAP